MRKALITTVTTMLFSLVACSPAPEKQVIGAWKNEDMMLVITEKTIAVDMGKSEPVTISPKGNKVLIELEKSRMTMTAEMLDKDTMLASLPVLGTGKFVRTTEDDVRAINQASYAKLFGKAAAEKKFGTSR